MGHLLRTTENFRFSWELQELTFSLKLTGVYPCLRTSMGNLNSQEFSNSRREVNWEPGSELNQKAFEYYADTN